jgi:hypothetical protein
VDAEFFVQILSMFFDSFDGAMDGASYPPVVVARGNQTKNLQLTLREMGWLGANIAFADWV